jgi:hypothetical protein
MSAKQIILGVCVVLIGINSTYAKSWRGIEPLHSTRADVERLFGPPVDKMAGLWIYDFPEERAFIRFSSGEPCEEGLPGGLKLPKDIVVYINTSPTIQKKMEEVLTPGKEYEQFQDPHTGSIHYLDSDEGIEFIVLGGLVQEIRYYGPKEQDYQCAEYKYAAPIKPDLKRPPRIAQMPFESFGNIRSDEAHARLDNYVIQLFDLKEKDPTWRGYIIVYAGRRSYRGEAQFKANCYKNYLVRVRKMDPASLFAVDGGFRDEFEVDLLYGRADEYPPILLPTVSPKKAQVIDRRLKSCSR